MENKRKNLIILGAVILFALPALATAQKADGRRSNVPQAEDGLSRMKKSADGLQQAAGRVLNRYSRGLAGAVLVLTDVYGKEYRTRSNQMGFFVFSGIRTGEPYHLEISHKTEVFAARLVSFDEATRSLRFSPE